MNGSITVSASHAAGMALRLLWTAVWAWARNDTVTFDFGSDE